ncbi:MAG: butyrate kinase [candidate division KSB1 bacterium]|jgi:butyrate kinase|nr:butyrate kinase [candidate division KSB1 bacterium]
MRSKILVINPGSTSTKVGIFEKDKEIVVKNIEHQVNLSASHSGIWDQFDIRKSAIVDFLQRNEIDYSMIAAVVGRGGLLKPIPGGTYTVTETMIIDAKEGRRGHHASNLGCALAKEIATAAGVQAYVVDPVSVDEFEPLARYSGHPLIERRSLSHTLSIHAVGRKAAEDLGIDYSAHNFIVAHLGGGISICPLKNGRIVDVNDASSSGPFSPERTGELPLQPFIDLCYSGEHTKTAMQRLVMGKGGLYAYLGTTDALKVEDAIAKGDRKAEEVYNAMAYQIAKEIGAMATVVNGNISAIVISGGLAKSDLLLDSIKKRVRYIAQVLVYPHEYEMVALAAGVLRVLEGEEKALDYDKCQSNT